MRFLLIGCVLLLTMGASKKEQPALQTGIDAAIASDPAFGSAFLGIQITRLSDGKTLYARNADHLFVPASNTKLFTTALALTRLGPDYRFKTSVIAEDENLVLIGRGDPSMSARQYPYSKEPSDGNPLQAIEEFADQLVGGGLKKVQGDVIGDDTRYPWIPYPAAWSIEDRIWEYGAPVSALTLNDNRIDVVISPGTMEGDPAFISIKPAFELFTIQNRVVTTASGKREIFVHEGFDSTEIVFDGTIPIADSGETNQLAIPDPALFASQALRDALIRRGVDVHGRSAARHRYAGQQAEPLTGQELASRVSPPLIELLQVIDKVSQNLHAEIMLREVGAIRRNDGTAKAGLAELHDFLAEAGISETEYYFADGSGLSRMNLVTPSAVTKLLTYMYAMPHREQWMGLLPVGGEDGSLRYRFKGHPEARAIQAKTGSLSHVRALSGYAESARYGNVAFSIILNNYLAKDVEVSSFLDNIGLKLIPRSAKRVN
jgi:D-alanyl-D-alanine carboxypeptidase/D-alanyl-D-alanine-endopeptidase (penicillin-binding protein 4)